MKDIIIPRIAVITQNIDSKYIRKEFYLVDLVEGICLHDISDMVQKKRKYGHINETTWDILNCELKDMIDEGKDIYVKSLIGIPTSYNPLGKLPEPIEEVDIISPKDRHVGNSDYSDKVIQPYDIWTEYKLDPFRADLIKRILRTKSEKGMTLREAKLLDLRKMSHIIETMIHKYETNNFPWDEE